MDIWKSEFLVFRSQWYWSEMTYPPPLPLSSKNEMLIFGLCSTSDDRPSNVSNESRLKCKKRPPKSSKNEMLIFGLRSTSDDWPSNLSDKSLPKCKERPPKSLKNEMLVFGLCSTSDDWLRNMSNESQPKCEKMATKWKWNEKIGFKNKVTFWFWQILLHVDHSVLWLHRNWYTYSNG